MCLVRTDDGCDGRNKEKDGQHDVQRQTDADVRRFLLEESWHEEEGKKLQETVLAGILLCKKAILLVTRYSFLAFITSNE